MYDLSGAPNVSALDKVLGEVGERNHAQVVLKDTSAWHDITVTARSAEDGRVGYLALVADGSKLKSVVLIVEENEIRQMLVL